jgi:hypothetical protein
MMLLSLNSEGRDSMNSNLNQYLYEVFRKEVKDPLHSSTTENQVEYKTHLNDERKKHFVLDSKYSLRLDEII